MSLRSGSSTARSARRRAPGRRRRARLARPARAHLAPVGDQTLPSVCRRALGRSRTTRSTRADPRFALPETDPLGATAWYRAQPEAVRARIGLHMIATFMKIGVQFESTLKRGLLEYARDAAERLGRVPLPVPRGDRGSAALADVPGVREPHRARRRRAAALRARVRARPAAPRATLPGAVLRVRARRRGSDRPHAAQRAAPRRALGASAACAASARST